MRTVKEIRDDIDEAQRELNELEKDFKQTTGESFWELHNEVKAAQDEINKITLDIKSIYHRLLTVKSNAELLARNGENTNETLEKVHEAFLLLIEYRRTLDAKAEKLKKLLGEREKFIQESEQGQKIRDARTRIAGLRQELKVAESQESDAAVERDRMIHEYLDCEREISDIEERLAYFYSEAPLCKKCKTPMEFELNGTTEAVFWRCPKSKPGANHPTKSYRGSHTLIAPLLRRKKELKEKLKPSNITIESTKRATLSRPLFEITEYPNILSDTYHNYLFQSLAVPSALDRKAHYTELLEYSRFRIFTHLPQEHRADDANRNIYSLALRLMNRGLVMGTYSATEAKIKRYFSNYSARSSLTRLNEYISYETPWDTYDSDREMKFAQNYFSRLLGKSWATYVYPQMPLTTLLPENPKKSFADQRVDFFVCYGDSKAVIELDGKEHEEQAQKQLDRKRDNALKKDGYTVQRFTNDQVDEEDDEICRTLKERIFKEKKAAVSVEFGEKHLVACKVVHQVAIAIVKMLEEGHITPHCNLSLEISTKLFTADEQNLLLMFAAEEVCELIENFAVLYGVKIDLNLFDETAEEYRIHIGDGDGERNSIVIRDIVLPINYLCSIRPFAQAMPKEEAVTEGLLQYFLLYVYGFSEFRPGQFDAIHRALCHKDSIVLLPTGSGKSVIYQLSSMLLPGITVVISPLRALIEDQVRNLSDRGIDVAVAIYRTDKSSQKKMEDKAQAVLGNHSATMLYIAPERMQIPEFRKRVDELLQENNFCLVAIDEAHCVSEWGHDFRAAYLQIGRSCRRIFKKGEFVPSILALTGTASDNVLRDVKRDLEISTDEAIITPSSFDRPELHYSVISCPKERKIEKIIDLLGETHQEICGRFPDKPKYEEFSSLRGKDTFAGIIFTPLTKGLSGDSPYAAWHLFNHLSKECPSLQIGTFFAKSPFEDTNGGKSKEAEESWECIIKSYAQEFKEDKKQLLVATKAFGMGIDKANIRYVIHCGISTSIEQYYQEVGRAGRGGDHSECILLFSDIKDELLSTLIDPNKSWEEFNKEYKKHRDTPKSDLQSCGDLSPLLHFHSKNFAGPEFEECIILRILEYLKEKTSPSSTDFVVGSEIAMPLDNVHPLRSSSHTTAQSKDQHEYDKEKASNEVAKAVVRLVTLGIIKDYEYDYRYYTFTIFLGSYARESVLENYRTFVENCSRGRFESEKATLLRFQGDDFSFAKQVISRYVKLVYDTIEKGRRRALHSMYLLAKEAANLPASKQDDYIREGIQNYLVKDDVVDLVKGGSPDSVIFEILNAYPLYPNAVIRDGVERENAKRTSGYAARMLESYPDHPGLLYLLAIAQIKSNEYHKQDVVNNIVAAYAASDSYADFHKKMPNTVFLLKVMNLAFHASCELFELLWDTLADQATPNFISAISSQALELDTNNISQDFKDYLLLHIAAYSLRRMIGDDNK